MKNLLKDIGIISLCASIAVVGSILLISARVRTLVETERTAWVKDCTMMGVHRIGNTVYVCSPAPEPAPETPVIK